jgi:hypothetical protein
LSEIRATTISDAAGTGPITLTGQMASKVWCHWTEQTTVSINGSFAASSLADEGTGQTGINFTSAMATDDYAITFSTNVADCGGFDGVTIGTTTKTTHQTRDQNGSNYDAHVACMICVGDLA